MEHTFHMTRVSGNSKTGPIPVTTSSSSTCPKRCSFKGSGCYAEQGPLALHWRAVDRGDRGGSLDELCQQIKKLPKHTLWRYGQAGDLPGDGTYLDGAAVHKLAMANLGRNGFAYTHYDPTIATNAWTIEAANGNGFTVNLSAETLEQADAYAELDIAPVVVVLPANATKSVKTPAGRTVTVCPATVREDTTCASCALCHVASRRQIVGFPAHGSGAKQVERVIALRRA